MSYTNDYNEIISMLIMLILYFAVYIFIFLKLNISRKMNIFILVAIILRILLTIIDTYVLYLPNSGADSIMFERHAYQLLEGNLSLKLYNFDNYPKMIYFIYLITGRKPVVIRAINGVLSMLTGILINKSIYITTENREKASTGMLIFLLFPNSLIFSSIILRESLVVFFSTLSIYYFIKYTQHNKLSNIIRSYIYLIIGSLFHGGIIFIGITYIYYVLKNKSVSVSSSAKKVIVYCIFTLIIFVIMKLPEVFLKKLSFLTSSEALFKRLNYINEYSINTDIGSAYLSYFRIYSFKDLILYTPIKIVYFLFSPMIWDIRGISDIIAISLDSIFYIVFLFIIFISFNNLDRGNKNYLLLKTLKYGLVLIISVYAMGTVASGTAIRHRYKCLTLIIIILMNIID